MSQVKLVTLHSTQNVDEKTIGAKAAALVRLGRIGFTVPPGFCTTAAAFSEHLEANNLITHIRSASDGLGGASPEERNSILSEIRQRVTNAPLVDSLREQIRNHYRALGADRVAVRSSATAEDLPGHSFAGLYETYLGIGDLESCIDAIKKCWASLWTERAYEYRQKNGFDHLKANMAVIIQSLIAADAAGVIFTADPATGRSNRIVIEACLGLGAALVSGKVTPDRFVINKKNLKVICRNISEKKIEFVLDDHGSVKERTVSGERACAPSIDKATVRKLAKSAKKVEAEFNCPQDIEWAVQGRKIYLLQSRPITALPPPRSWQDRQVWTNANTGEVLPDVVTPITWSLVRTLLDEVFDRTLDLVAIERGDHPLFGLIAGRAYFNINTLVGVLKFLPVLRHLSIDRFFGGEHQKMHRLGRLHLADEDIPYLRFNIGKMIVRLPGLCLRIVCYRPKKGERMLAEIESIIDQVQASDTSGLREEQLAGLLMSEAADLRRRLTDVRHGAIYAIMGMAAFTTLDKICRKWFREESTTLANRLLAGVGNMDSAQAGHELWTLALSARKVAAVEKTIRAGRHWHELAKRISELQQAEQFLREWNDFMARHGHHCRGEIEVFNKRWAETPDYILRLLQNYMDCTAQTDPLDEYTKRGRQRRQLEQQCRRHLRNPVKRMIFDYLLTQAQAGSRIRENSKNQLARLVGRWRKILVALGAKLCSKGILKNPDDIFFVEFQEIDAVTRGRPGFDLKKVIADRRARYERNKSVSPPPVVVGRFDPDKIAPEAVDADAEVLQGLAVSPGVATGKARVILRSDDQQQVLPGEVLVAPFTDPGWVPYFVPAAGIVMEQGGLLSHGSIIAREYGIPTVVNVGPATKIIKTGQTVQVDGNRGVVTILR